MAQGAIGIACIILLVLLVVLIAGPRLWRHCGKNDPRARAAEPERARLGKQGIVATKPRRGGAPLMKAGAPLHSAAARAVPLPAAGALVLPLERLVENAALAMRPTCAPFDRSVFEGYAAFFVRLAHPACDELAIIDSGWFGVNGSGLGMPWVAWESSGPKVHPWLAAAQLGASSEAAMGVGGRVITDELTVYDLPALPVRVAGRPATDLVAASGVRSVPPASFAALRPTLVTGSRTGASTLFPQALLTGYILQFFACVFTLARASLVLYPLAPVSGAAPLLQHVRHDHPHLGRFDKLAKAPPDVGSVICLRIRDPRGVVRPLWFFVDTGAINIGFVVLPWAAPYFGCYSPPIYGGSRGVAGAQCYPMIRATVVDDAKHELTLAGQVGGEVGWQPPGAAHSLLAGRVGSNVLGFLDFFVARVNGDCHSAYAITLDPAFVTLVECATTPPESDCTPPAGTAPPVVAAGGACFDRKTACAAPTH